MGGADYDELERHRAIICDFVYLCGLDQAGVAWPQHSQILVYPDASLARQHEIALL